MLHVKTVDEVFSIIENYFPDSCPGAEMIEIKDAVGRIVAEDIASHEDIPGFNRSMVDGYAVKASDTFGASESIPAQLELVGEIKMGEKPAFSINSAQAAYIPTGGELPEGADSVVMVEYTEDFRDGFVYITKASAPGSHVIFTGDDVKEGSTVIRAGSKLRPQDIGIMAAVGYAEVAVKKRIRVGIISTGDEVVDIREKIDGAKVRDINSYALYAGLCEYGAEPVLYGIVGDQYENVKKAVDKALSECDMVLISGGSSVGTKDETFKVINSLDEPGVLVHGIAVKPGKPTILGKVKNKAVVGLPGHPVSAYMIYRIFVTRLLDTMSGLAGKSYHKINARMACGYPSNHGREEFLPVRLEQGDGKYLAAPVFGKSGLITSLTRAQGYVHISRGSEGLMEGQEVEVILL